MRNARRKTSSTVMPLASTATSAMARILGLPRLHPAGDAGDRAPLGQRGEREELLAKHAVVGDPRLAQLLVAGGGQLGEELAAVGGIGRARQQAVALQPGDEMRQPA